MNGKFKLAAFWFFIGALTPPAWAGPSNLIIASEGVKARKIKRQLEEYDREARARTESFDFAGKWSAAQHAPERDLASDLVMLVQHGMELRILTRSASPVMRALMCTSALKSTGDQFALEQASLVRSPFDSDPRLASYAAEVDAQLKLLDDYCTQRRNALLDHVPSHFEALVAARDIEWASQSATDYVLSRPIVTTKLAETRDPETRLTRVQIIPREAPNSQPAR